MMKCWRYRPQDRPTFAELSMFLWQLEHEGNTYVNTEPLITSSSLSPHEGRTISFGVSSLFLGFLFTVILMFKFLLYIADGRTGDIEQVNVCRLFHTKILPFFLIPSFLLNIFRPSECLFSYTHNPCMLVFVLFNSFIA